MNDKVKLTYIGTEWTTGFNYSENCEMCQDRSGLHNMLPLPTIKVQLQHHAEVGEDKHQYVRDLYLCKGCIDRGLAAGQIEATNQEPAGCPFVA